MATTPPELYAVIEKYVAERTKSGLYRVSFGYEVETLKPKDRVLPDLPQCIKEISVSSNSVDVILCRPRQPETLIYTGVSDRYGQFSELTEVLIKGRSTREIPLTAATSSILITNTQNCDRAFFRAVTITARPPVSFLF